MLTAVVEDPLVLALDAHLVNLMGGVDTLGTRSVSRSQIVQRTRASNDAGCLSEPGERGPMRTWSPISDVRALKFCLSSGLGEKILLFSRIAILVRSVPSSSLSSPITRSPSLADRMLRCRLYSLAQRMTPDR